MSPLPFPCARAAAWYEYIHYGLWRIVDPVPAPGLWCTELVSGTVRYVEFPPEATAGLARWTVWLGGIVPVDGIWHSTGLGVKLSPAEGDAAAALNLATAAATMLSSPGAMQLRTLQTLDGLGPSASNTVVLALPLEMIDVMRSYITKNNRPG